MQIESRFIHSSKPSQADFGKSPKPFDTINVSLSIGEFIFSMVDAKMFSISDIDKSIVVTPSVGVDDAFHGDSNSDNGLQSGFGAIRNNFSIDLPWRLRMPKTMVLLEAPRPLLPLIRRAPKKLSSTSPEKGD